MNAFATMAGVVFALVLFAILFGALLAFPVMWLWNSCLVGAVAGVSQISWLQAWGLLILSAMLFKSPASSCESK